MFYRANLLAWYGKETKANTTKARIHQSKEMYYEINTKKTKTMFSRLLRHLVWKQSASILKGKDK